MLTIQIKDGTNKVVAVVNDIFSLTVDDEVNKWGKLKLRFPTEERLQEKPLKKGYRISVVYGRKIWETIRLFEWYITDVILKTTTVEIEADNWLSYLQYRMLRYPKNYTDTQIKDVVSQVFSELNTTYALPISLGLNDCTTTITRDFDVWTSFYDILKHCREAEPKLVVRVLNWDTNVLEVSKDTGDVLPGVWEFDVNFTKGTNIVDRTRKDTMDEYYNYIKNDTGDVSDSEAIEETNLLFEKYEAEAALSIPSGLPLPSIQVSRDTDRWDFNIGDRKNIRLNTGYEWLELQYLGLIQNRKITINANGGIKADIKITEEYKADTNILDLILQNLRKK